MKKRSWNITVDRIDISAEESAGGFSIDGEVFGFQSADPKNSVMQIGSDGVMTNVYVNRLDDSRYEVWVKHHVFEVIIEDSRHRLLKQFSGTPEGPEGVSMVRAPMPGLVTKLQVKVGDPIEKGTGLVILEAMKMENEIRSPIKGIVTHIEVQARSNVEKGQPLMTLQQT
jgi:pyruvate carboxylase subunit B